MHLPPALQQELSRRRLTAAHARAQGGSGERASRAKGSGSEFADFRPYQPGDDIRSLDARVTARLGVPVVREFVLAQQLPILLLLDASASMRLGNMGPGRPAKFELARQLAATLAFVALAGGDLVQAASFGAELRVSPRMQGVNRASELLGWLGASHVAERGSTGAMTLSDALSATAGRAPRGALVIVVSDFLSEDAPDALGLAHARRQEVLAVQVLAPEELDPAQLFGGKSGSDKSSSDRSAVRLNDVESGEHAVVLLDAATLERYRAALNAWTETLRQRLSQHGGRLVQARSDQRLETVVLRELLARDVIR